MKKTMVVAALMLSTQLSTQVAAENVFVRGMGNLTCGNFIHRNYADDNAYQHWVGGYLTAAAEMSPVISAKSASTNLAGIMAWLDQFCHANPMRTIFHAVESLGVQWGRETLLEASDDGPMNLQIEPPKPKNQVVKDVLFDKLLKKPSR